jgi:hypothetical protein
LWVALPALGGRKGWPMTRRSRAVFCCDRHRPRSSTVTEGEVDAVADELTAWPRKGLDFANPEQLAEPPLE